MTPIYKSLYQAFTARELRPRGWLKRQLRIQAEGLSGHLDKMWPDVQDAAWIGGSRDGWERVPYWLDGFIPLAFLLDDDDLKARAKKYVDGILARQQPDGWLCPCRQEERRQYDLWALFIICKALMVYADCSGDERIEDAIYRAMKNLLQHLRGCTLFGWGQSRWFEALLPLKWLQEKRPEPWMEARCPGHLGISHPYREPDDGAEKRSSVFRHFGPGFQRFRQAYVCAADAVSRHAHRPYPGR